MSEPKSESGETIDVVLNCVRLYAKEHNLNADQIRAIFNNGIVPTIEAGIMPSTGKRSTEREPVTV